ncbi:MAG: hypothetical protein R3344_00425 [Acidobacteriota bacterium]|nr:hypothetical protein [Acidobacteriota bacterium]
MFTRPLSSPPLRRLAFVVPVLLFLPACTSSEAPDVAHHGAPLPEPVASSPAPDAVASTAAGSAVRVVYRDPETGQLTSTRPEGVAPVEDPTLAERGVGDFHRGVTVIRHDDGTLEFTRPEGFRVKLVATLDENGNLTVRHSTRPSPSGDSENEEVAHER